MRVASERWLGLRGGSACSLGQMPRSIPWPPLAPEARLPPSPPLIQATGDQLTHTMLQLTTGFGERSSVTEHRTRRASGSRPCSPTSSGGGTSARRRCGRRTRQCRWAARRSAPRPTQTRHRRAMHLDFRPPTVPPIDIPRREQAGGWIGGWTSALAAALALQYISMHSIHNCEIQLQGLLIERVHNMELNRLAWSQQLLLGATLLDVRLGDAASSPASGEARRRPGLEPGYRPAAPAPASDRRVRGA